jgi:hypothetical protein
MKQLNEREYIEIKTKIKEERSLYKEETAKIPFLFEKKNSFK